MSDLSSLLSSLLTEVAADVVNNTRFANLDPHGFGIDAEMLLTRRKEAIAALNSEVQRLSNGRYHIESVSPAYFFAPASAGVLHLGRYYNEGGKRRLLTVGPFPKAVTWSSELEGEELAEALLEEATRERIETYQMQGGGDLDETHFYLLLGIRDLPEGALTPEQRSDIEHFANLYMSSSNLRLVALAAACRVLGKTIGEILELGIASLAQK